MGKEKTTKYRITYSVFGESFAVEYETEDEAERNMEDIRGYAHVSDVQFHTIHGPNPIRPGPFKLTNRFEREDPI